MIDGLLCSPSRVFEETIPIEHLELHDEWVQRHSSPFSSIFTTLVKQSNCSLWSTISSEFLEEPDAPEKSSPSSSLRLKDLIPVLYQEGRYQGEPVTLGVGGFGRVELVHVFGVVVVFGYL